MSIVPTLFRDIPPYVWVTPFDIMLVLELTDEDVSYDTLKVTLSRLVNEGRIISRKIPRSESGKHRSPQDHRMRSRPETLYLMTDRLSAVGRVNKML